MTKAMKTKWKQFGMWVGLAVIGIAMYWWGVQPRQTAEASGCLDTALVWEYTPTDLCFGGGDQAEVTFEWNDGKLNVGYDPNEVEQSAVTFFNVMLPYLNDNIEAEIKRRME